MSGSAGGSEPTKCLHWTSGEYYPDCPGLSCQRYGSDWSPEEQAQMDQIDQRVYELHAFEDHE